jgi:polyvinyl alcohol dehydrogenase (cytochrome)
MSQDSILQLAQRFVAGIIVFAAAVCVVDARGQAKPDDGPLGTEAGFGVFQRHCTSCHGNPDAPQRVPSPSTLRQLAPEKIYEALSNGTMKVQARGLSDEEKCRVAESLSGRRFGRASSGDAKNMSNPCPGNPPTAFDLSAGPAWNGWGADISNTRFQANAGLAAEQVSRLKLKWAFGYPNGVTAAGQPTIVGGRIFVGADIGYVYSLDAATGCVYWSFQANASVRNAISIGPVTGHEPAKYAAYFGDGKANVYAVDVSNGKLLWTTHVEDHFTARVTGAPTLYDGRLYVPVSSFEEFAAQAADYPCCTFRGSVVALDANTGRQVWKTYVIPEEPKPTRKNSQGMQLFAPAGASVWNSPTVDVERHAIYFGTGDAETEPAAPTSDAIMALDMNTGEVLWTFQGTEHDSYLVGCPGPGKKRSDNCPRVEGPDWDFGASPILRTLAGGHRILVAAQKSGNIFGLDPDRRGALRWKVNVESKRPRPNPVLVWGGAADEQNAYFGLTSGGMVAIRLTDGARQWFTPMVAKGFGPERVGMGAAATAIPGAVLVGGWDGMLHALSTADGRKLWEFRTARKFTTVNRVAAKGGSFGAPGPTVAGGMLFVGSGYGVFGDDIPGNVLLAFSIE